MSNENTSCHPPMPSQCTKQDFILSEGAKVVLNKGHEVKHDFTLTPNPFKDFGTISGIVRDPMGNPIANALVKVFDDKHRPFAHVFTNHEGQFLFCIPPGHYVLKAVK